MQEEMLKVAQKLEGMLNEKLRGKNFYAETNRIRGVGDEIWVYFNVLPCGKNIGRYDINKEHPFADANEFLIPIPLDLSDDNKHLECAAQDYVINLIGDMEILRVMTGLYYSDGFY